jgi:3-oxoacyl-[acyl-carrier-protein] synthase-3
VGVRIIGTGHHVPEGKLTNFDLAQMMDTSDEWIVQRTGIHERRICDASKGESTTWLCTKALEKAIAAARIDATEIDLIIVASVSGEMTCPSTACRVSANVGATKAAAFDILAACSGFVFATQVAHDMIRAGSHRTVAVIGCDVMSRIVDYHNRAVSILFGDSAGAAIYRATDDTTRGLIAASMHADGTRWHDLYLPRTLTDIPEGADPAPVKMGALQMNGREVYKFAVGTFTGLIAQTLESAGVTADDVDMFVCHQSNARMLESARERFGIPHEKMYVNIDRFGNCSAGSVPVALDELRQQGKCAEGDLIMLVAFGGGLTWGASLWRL